MSEWKNRIKSSKGYSPKELIDTFEEILRLEKPLQSDRLSLIDRAQLLGKIEELLGRSSLMVNEEIRELHTKEPKDLVSTEETRYYFEPFISYLEELIFYVCYHPQRRGSILSRSPEIRKKLMKSERKMFKDDIIFYKLVEKTVAKMNFLKNLQFRDKLNITDKGIRVGLELISFVYISKYINMRLRSIILDKDEAKELKILEDRISKYHKFILILDKILQYSLSIENDNLDETAESLAIEERNKLRFIGYKFSLDIIKNNLEEDQARMVEFKAFLKKEKKKLLKLKASKKYSSL